jgi:hypothetical protein
MAPSVRSGETDGAIGPLVTAMWADCFAVCDAGVLVLTNPAGLIFTTTAVIVTGLASRPLVRWRVARLGGHDPFAGDPGNSR